MTWTEDDCYEYARDRKVEERRERYEEILAEQADRDPFDGLPAFDNVALPGLGA